MILGNKDLIKNFFDIWEMKLDNEQINQLEVYMDLLISWNKKINLTTIIDPEEIVIKHFIDSSSLLKCIILKEQPSVIDIGTGAGFPGVILKIIRPDIRLTLLDSLNKRLTFLKELLLNLKLDATLIHSRAEDAAHKVELREKFDLVTARAVARMNVLIEYCLPYVKIGGIFCPMKGPEVDEELNDSKRILSLLGGTFIETDKFKLPDGSKRSIVVITKVKNTPALYPRKPNKISKKP